MDDRKRRDHITCIHSRPSTLMILPNVAYFLKKVHFFPAVYVQWHLPGYRSFCYFCYFIYFVSAPDKLKEQDPAVLRSGAQPQLCAVLAAEPSCGFHRAFVKDWSWVKSLRSHCGSFFCGEGLEGHWVPEVPLRNAWLIAKTVINYADREQRCSVGTGVGERNEGGLLPLPSRFASRY